MKLHLKLNWHGIAIFTRTIELNQVWEGMVVRAKRDDLSDLYNFSIQHLFWQMPEEATPPDPGSIRGPYSSDVFDEYFADAFPFGVPCREQLEVVMNELQKMGWKKVNKEEFNQS